MTFIIFLIGLFGGWKLREYTAVRRMHQMMAEAEKKKTDIDRVSVKIEKHDGVFYFFNRETDEFLAQGSNKEEVTAHLSHRFKDKNVSFHATEENMKEVDFK